MDKVIVPTMLRPFMRRLLSEILRTDSDFEAFCMDYCHPVERRFTSGMDRVQKTNILFHVIELEKIFLALQVYNPEQFNASYEATRRCMDPPKNIRTLSGCAEELFSHNKDSVDIKLAQQDAHSFADLTSAAQSLINSLPTAPREEHAISADIFNASELISADPIYRLPSGRYVAQTLSIIENTCSSEGMSVLKPGYITNVQNDAMTGTVSILTATNILLGSGAVRNNVGTLTSNTAFINNNEQWQSERIIQLQIIGNARVSLLIEDRRKARISLGLWKRNLPDCVVRWRMDIVSVSPE